MVYVYANYLISFNLIRNYMGLYMLLICIFVLKVLSTGLGRIVPNLISRKHTNSAATGTYFLSEFPGVCFGSMLVHAFHICSCHAGMLAVLPFLVLIDRGI